MNRLKNLLRYAALCSVSFGFGCLETVRGSEYSDAVDADGPLAYWRLGETDLNDPALNRGSLGAAADGSYEVGVGLGRPSLIRGDSGTAAMVSGGRVSIPGFEKFAGGTGFSAELWAGFNSVSGGFTNLFGDGESGGDFNFMIYAGGEGFIRPHLFTDGGVTSIDSQRAVNAGEIVHIVSTWDAATGQLDLYLDGELAALRREGGNPNSGSPINTDNPVFIGRDNRESAPDVVIDEVAFYDYPLTAAQIKTHFELGVGAILPPPPPPNVGFADPGNLTNLPSELVAYWDFDEGAAPDPANGNDFAYDRQADHDGSFGGTATRVPGLIGTGAAEFNTTAGDHVNVGNGGPENAFSFTSGMTVEAVIAPDEGLGTIRYQEIFRKEDGGNRILLSFQENGGILSFGINDGGGYSELDMPIDGVDGRPTLDYFLDGSPRHVAAAYDAASGFKGIYLDGELVFEDNLSPGVDMVSGGAAPAFIGSLGFSGEPFGGIIDEVALWSVALTDIEIREHAARVADGNNYFQPSEPLTIAGSGQTYFQDFNELGVTGRTMPKGWNAEDAEGVSRRIDGLGLTDGFLTVPGDDADGVLGVLNLGGNAGSFSTPAAGHVATWNAELGGANDLFGRDDAIADNASDRALGISRVENNDVGELNFEIEIAGGNLRAFVLDWDLEIWGGDPDAEFRSPEGPGMKVDMRVGATSYGEIIENLLPGALFDSIEDGGDAGHNATLIDGNVHSIRGITSGIKEVSDADGAVGNMIQINFNSNWNDATNGANGWFSAVDNVRLRALAPGDADANGVVDVADLLQLLGGQKFNQGVAGVTWAEGDFNADDQFNTGDLLAMLAFLSGQFPSDPYASEAGEASDAVADVIVNSETGEVTVDLAGHTVSAILIESASEIFNGQQPQWDTTSQFPSTLPGELGNVLFTTTAAGVDELGAVISTEFLGRDKEFYLQDLDLNILIASEGGTLTKGNVIVVPEPSTWVLLIIGTTLVGWRQAKRSPGMK